MVPAAAKQRAFVLPFGVAAREVKLERHQPIRDPNNRNRPTMVPALDRLGQPLGSLALYDKEMQQAQEDNKALLEKHNIRR